MSRWLQVRRWAARRFQTRRYLTPTGGCVERPDWWTHGSSSAVTRSTFEEALTELDDWQMNYSGIAPETPGRARPEVEAIVAIMQRHGLRITQTGGSDGPGDMWTAAHEIVALTTEAAEPLTPKVGS